MGNLSPPSEPQREPGTKTPELADAPEMGTFRLEVPSSHPPAPCARFSRTGPNTLSQRCMGFNLPRSGDGYALSKGFCNSTPSSLKSRTFLVTTVSL